MTQKTHRLVQLKTLVVFLALFVHTGQPADCKPDSAVHKHIALLVRFLGELQDSQPSGLVPITRGGDATTTYSNAMAAIAFTAGRRIERARRIFEVFAGQPDPCPAAGFPGPACACQGGFQQHRQVASGGPLPTVGTEPNDFWIGDNAWLLAAVNYYRQQTGDGQFDLSLIDRLQSWFACLEAQTPDPGIYSGYRKHGALMDFRHPEGSIDVLGALRGSGATGVRESVQTWIDQEVWVPTGDCFEIGAANGAPHDSHLPLDNVSWGFLAMGSDYRCLLSHAEARLARTWDPRQIELFDADPVGEPPCEGAYWGIDRVDDTVQLDLARAQHGQGHDLVITYSLQPDKWLRICRSERIDLPVGSAFRYFFWIRGDGSNHRFEVKLANVSGKSFIYDFPLDFSDWRLQQIRYDQFQEFDPMDPRPEPLGEIGQIEFAVNNSSASVTEERQIRIGRIWYQDSSGPYRLPIDGFAAFETEQNRLWVEGTAQMAAAYCAAGQMARWHHYADELARLASLPGVRPRPPSEGQEDHGLPNSLHAGVSRYEPESVATSWYVVALSCLNPFEP